MKESGIDGLSRGDMLEGMLKGEEPLQFLPINKSVWERGGDLVKEWLIECWTLDGGEPWGGKPLTFLNPEGWFREGHGKGIYVWAPPPAAAAVAVEMFAEARLKRTEGTHIFVVPRLMTHLWRKQLGKDADLMFDIPVGSAMWPLSQHEPLIVAIILPFSHKPRYRGPWLVREASFAATAGRILKQEFTSALEKRSWGHYDVEGSLCGLSRASLKPQRDYMRKFLHEALSFPSMPESMVREVLHSTPGGSVSSSGSSRKRGRRSNRTVDEGGQEVQGREKRRPSDGDAILLRAMLLPKSDGKGPMARQLGGSRASNVLPSSKPGCFLESRARHSSRQQKPSSTRFGRGQEKARTERPYTKVRRISIGGLARNGSGSNDTNGVTQAREIPGQSTVLFDTKNSVSLQQPIRGKRKSPGGSCVRKS